MSFIFGTKNNAAAQQKSLGLNTLNASTNEQANPLPYLAGKRRFAGTFITDAFDQRADNGSGGKDSGKGGGGSGTNYFAGFAVAFCLGPCDGFHDLWLNGEPVYTSNTPLTPVSLKENSNIATFQTANAHGLSTGQSVVVTGADQPEFNGEFVITVVSAKQFQYIIPGSTLSAETATGQIKAWVKLDPIYRGAEDSIDITIPNYGVLTLHWGTETQPADDYLQISGTNHPPNHGVCYIVFQRFFLGLNQTNIQNVEVTLSRTPKPDWLSNVAHANISDEANAACIFYELLTHPRCGLGLTDDDFDTAALDFAATQFYNESLGISPILTRTDSALSVEQQLLQTIDGIIKLNDDLLLTLIPVRKPTDYTKVQVVTDDMLADIPQPQTDDWSNTFNDTRIIFPNQDASWNNDFVEWFDFAAQTAALKTAQPQTLNLDFLTRRDLALSIVQAYGAAAAVPKQTGRMSLLFSIDLWTSLSPGTVFQNNFTDPTCARSNGFFRITKRTIADSSKPVFTVEYAADQSYLNFAADAEDDDTPEIGGDTPVPGLDAILAPNFLMLELPAVLCPNSKPAIAAIIGRDQSSTILANLYLGRNYSFTGTPPDSFFPLATIKGFGYCGKLTADFPASTDFITPDNTLPAEAPDDPFPLCEGMEIQLYGVDLILPEMFDFDSLANSFILVIGDEIMSVSNASMTDDGAYELTVVRGRFGTTIADHASGDPLYMIALSNLLPIQHPHFLAANTGAFKLTLGAQSVGDVDEFDVVFDGSRWTF